jgi:hypothetical protein
MNEPKMSSVTFSDDGNPYMISKLGSHWHKYQRNSSLASKFDYPL